MGTTINPFGQDIVSVTGDFCGQEISFEVGRMTFQASASVTARVGDAVVQGIVMVADHVDPHIDYFPLSIDYEEKMYAAGKISGSRFIKREGRPSEQAILTGRLIDRPIRPLFPKGYRNPVQAIATVLSVDPNIKTDMVAMAAVSAALSITGAPFDGPIAGVRIGQVDGELIAQPSVEQMENSKLDLVVAGTKDAIMMVEAGADEVDEATMVESIRMAHEAMQPIIALQEELKSKLEIAEQEYDLLLPNEDVQAEVDAFLSGKLGEKVRANNQKARAEAIAALKKEAVEHFEAKLADTEDSDDAPSLKDYKEAFESAIKKEVRRAIVEDGIRPDNRASDEIRPLSSEVSVLPRTHGSALFTRGSTQGLNVTTLAPMGYAQVVDTMESDEEVFFFHHYNMPGYTVGEVRRLGSAGRREIGHGHLATRAIEPMLPSQEDFPYTVRSVTEIQSSNGSTSMAAVCSACLSLMDAGVPIKRPVSGIAMGLVTGGKEPVILSDIQGTEDFAGDMDFKVAGTTEGITALQMDIKVHGITPEIMADALAQAKKGRAHILEHMLSTLPAVRKELSEFAPQVTSMTVDPDKVREIIGKGGETINKIIDETGAEIDIRDGGLVMISSPDKPSIDAAIKMIEDIVAEPEVGTVYDGTVVKLMDFGAFVNILPGKDGLVHVSAMKEERVESPSDVVSEGDKVRVKLVAIDDRGRLNLSMINLDD